MSIGKKNTDSLTIDAIVNDINRTTDELEIVITGAGEASLLHGVNYIPISFYQVTTAKTTGTGILYPGTTAWTNRNIFVRATSTGTYHLRVRR